MQDNQLDMGLSRAEVALRAQLLRSLRVRRIVMKSLFVAVPLLVGFTLFAYELAKTQTYSLLFQFALVLDAICLVLIAAFLLFQIQYLWQDRRRRSAGAQLHSRLVTVFILMALIPAITIAAFSTVTFNMGLESWFSTRVKNVIDNSYLAAQAYRDEHRQSLTSDGEVLRNYIYIRARGEGENLAPAYYRDYLDAGIQEVRDDISNAFVIDSMGEIYARGDGSFKFDFIKPTESELDAALLNDMTIIEDWQNDEFRLIAPLVGHFDRFIYLTRPVDGEILSLLSETESTVLSYKALEDDRTSLSFRFMFIYIALVLLILLFAVWAGLSFADKIARPIGRLAKAAKDFGEGHMDVRVPHIQGDGEIAVLSQSFNQMTAQVQKQKEELSKAGTESERGRRLFNSVLEGVSSGVLGTDNEGLITFFNPAAERLLDKSASQLDGRALAETIPEFMDIYENVTRTSDDTVQKSVELVRAGKLENLLVRVNTRRNAQKKVEGYVISFEDVTKLVQAQRMAAWSDVARRIAHEIKNPLTPIQLSAERIKRKYGANLEIGDSKLNDLCDVIIRQSNDLRRIVDSFSKFARMPVPEKTEGDVMAPLRQAVSLHRSSVTNIEFDVEIPEHVSALFDRTMLSQAFTNLIKNAIEAIQERQVHSAEHIGIIRIRCEYNDELLRIHIEDNGVGLPKDRTHLFEPYVTMKSEGTGLGLSIVKKIIEEHEGVLELSDATAFHSEDGKPMGANATITLPVFIKRTEDAA